MYPCKYLGIFLHCAILYMCKQGTQNPIVPYIFAAELILAFVEWHYLFFHLRLVKTLWSVVP